MGVSTGPGIVLGIFVGGASRRMGGRPKGALPAPDTGEPLVARLARVGREAGLLSVLVGDASPYRALALDLPALTDEPSGAGPLGGLASLLVHAGDRDAIAVACDMPFVEPPLLARMAKHASDAAILAPRRGPRTPWEPFLARYRSPRVLLEIRAELARGGRSFQGLFARLDVDELVLTGDERRALEDWDVPGDLR